MPTCTSLQLDSSYLNHLNGGRDTIDDDVEQGDVAGQDLQHWQEVSKGMGAVMGPCCRLGGLHAYPESDRSCYLDPVCPANPHLLHLSVCLQSLGCVGNFLLDTMQTEPDVLLSDKERAMSMLPRVLDNMFEAWRLQLGNTLGSNIGGHQVVS